MSNLAPRPNCCDNCTNGLSSWKLSDLYDEIDDEGVHDFAKEAKILLRSMKCLKEKEILVEKNRLKKFIVGKYDQGLRGATNLQLYGSGRQKSEFYWIALIEQLCLNKYIDMLPGTTQLTLNNIAEQWLSSPKPLLLKAIGQMFEFLPKKQSTPIYHIQNPSSEPKSMNFVNSRAMQINFKPNDEVLKRILAKVRDVLAQHSISDRELVASKAALDKMTSSKPQNYDEFKCAAIDGFTVNKINKFGPTFINAISKYTVK